jgi:hypothetical protein
MFSILPHSQETSKGYALKTWQKYTLLWEYFKCVYLII